MWLGLKTLQVSSSTRHSTNRFVILDSITLTCSYVSSPVYDMCLYTEVGDFWLGLETMHLLTTHPHSKYVLWVTITDKWHVPHIFPYDSFKVLDEDSGYKVQVTGYQGKLSDPFSVCNGKPFVAIGCENSLRSRGSHSYNRGRNTPLNCIRSTSKTGGGGWWFSSYGDYRNLCGATNLNARRPYWSNSFASDNFIKAVEMKIRPLD